jgi:DNA topoisomerase IB
MLRESRIEEASDRISEVASAIAEEGLRYVSDSSPGYRRKRSGTSLDFSAKDFRTWAGTVLAALALSEFKKYDSQAEAKRNVVPPSRGWRSNSAIHRPSVERVTCTPRY